MSDPSLIDPIKYILSFVIAAKGIRFTRRDRRRDMIEKELSFIKSLEEASKELSEEFEQENQRILKREVRLAWQTIRNLGPTVLSTLESAKLGFGLRYYLVPGMVLFLINLLLVALFFSMHEQLLIISICLLFSFFGIVLIVIAFRGAAIKINGDALGIRVFREKNRNIPILANGKKSNLVNKLLNDYSLPVLACWLVLLSLVAFVGLLFLQSSGVFNGTTQYIPILSFVGALISVVILFTYDCVSKTFDNNLAQTMLGECESRFISLDESCSLAMNEVLLLFQDMYFLNGRKDKSFKKNKSNDLKKLHPRSFRIIGKDKTFTVRVINNGYRPIKDCFETDDFCIRVFGRTGNIEQLIKKHTNAILVFLNL